MRCIGWTCSFCLLFAIRQETVKAQTQYIAWPQTSAIIYSENQAWSGELYLQSRAILNESRFQVGMISAYANYKIQQSGIMPGLGITMAYLPEEGANAWWAFLYQFRIHHNHSVKKTTWSNRITYDYLSVREKDPDSEKLIPLISLNRLRYLTGITVPVGESYRIFAYEEIFLFRNEFPLSENRFQLGISKTIHPNLFIGTYYFNRWVQPVSPDLPVLFEHALLMSLTVIINSRETQPK